MPRSAATTMPPLLLLPHLSFALTISTPQTPLDPPSPSPSLPCRRGPSSPSSPSHAPSCSFGPPLPRMCHLVASDPLSLFSFAHAISAMHIPSDPPSPPPPPPDPLDPPPLLPLPHMRSLGPLDPAWTPLSLTRT